MLPDWIARFGNNWKRWSYRSFVISRETMMTSSNGTFSASLAICAGNSPVTGEFPAQRPVTRSFDVFFDLRQNKRLSKQSWGRWFETPLRSLWRHCHDVSHLLIDQRLCCVITLYQALYALRIFFMLGILQVIFNKLYVRQKKIIPIILWSSPRIAHRQSL